MSSGKEQIGDVIFQGYQATLITRSPDLYQVAT